MALTRYRKLLEIISPRVLNLYFIQKDRDNILEQVESISDETTKLNTLIELLVEHLENLLKRELLNNSISNVSLSLYVNVLSAFIESNISETSDVYSKFSNIRIEFRNENIYELAFKLGSLEFLNNEPPNELCRRLASHVKIEGDTLGLDLFGKRKSFYLKMQKPTLLSDNKDFYEMLNKLELSGGKVVVHDNETRFVPKRVHLIWDGGIPSDDYKKNIVSWKKLNPEYNVVVYMDHTEHKPDFIKFKKWCLENNILIINIHDALHDSPYYNLFLDANNSIQMYGSSFNLYGTASDIARYILLERYGGIYADIPDVKCLKALGDLKGNKLFRGNIYSFNNDFIIIGNEKGKAKLGKVLQSVTMATFEGWPTIISNKHENEFSIEQEPRLRETRLTVYRTGSVHLVKADQPDLSVLLFSESKEARFKKLDDLVESGYTSSWIPNQKSSKAVLPNMSQLSDDVLVDYVEKAITSILTEVRYIPNVLNLDRYPIFTNDNAVEIALWFLSAYFPSIISKIENIISYTANPKVLLNYYAMFPNLREPFICLLCETRVDPPFRVYQRDFVINILKLKPDLAKDVDRMGRNIFLNACQGGNYILAEALLDLEPELYLSEYEPEYDPYSYAGEKQKYTALNYVCTYFIPLFRSKEYRTVELVKKMFTLGLQIETQSLNNDFRLSLKNGHFDLALFLFTNKLDVNNRVNQYLNLMKSPFEFFSSQIQSAIENRWFLQCDTENQAKDLFLETILPYLFNFTDVIWREAGEQQKNMCSEALLIFLAQIDKLTDIKDCITKYNFKIPSSQSFYDRLLENESSLIIFIEFICSRGIDLNYLKIKNPSRNDEQTLLDYCIDKDASLSVFDLMMSKGASANINKEIPSIIQAAKTRRWELVELMLSKGADIKAVSSDGSLLHFATKNRDINQINFLIQKRVPINAIDKFDQTALDCAVREGEWNIAKLLIENGADTSSLVVDSYMTLYTALQFNDPEMMRFVLTLGVNINARNDIYNRSIIEWAIRLGKWSIAKILIQNGADITNLIVNSFSTLDSALDTDDLEIMRFVLTLGVNINAQSYNLTILDQAIKSNKWDMVQLLIEHGADTSNIKGIKSLPQNIIKIISEKDKNIPSVNMQRTPK